MGGCHSYIMKELLYYCVLCIYLSTHNHVYRELKVAVQRCRLDRRRIEAAHLQFAVLQVSLWYQLDLNKLPLHSNTDSTLSDVVREYHGLFMAHYAS